MIHGHVFKSRFCLSRFVCASLITFYANCKRIEKATQVFNEAVYRNVVICTALLTGCGSNGRHEDGLKVYNKCGGVADAVVVFKRLGEKNIVTWNVVVCGFAQHA
ncbi:hypothetical protein NL676_036605 [Syzygium grande]|nr:hypothetical protein NL676_036605 [Syzygium grande]